MKDFFAKVQSFVSIVMIGIAYRPAGLKKKSLYINSLAAHRFYLSIGGRLIDVAYRGAAGLPRTYNFGVFRQLT